MSETLNDKLEAFFKLRPGEWIDGRDLAGIAGAYAWRSRCSDLRKHRGMTIENRQRQDWNFSRGERYTISEYRYVPDLPTHVEPSGQGAFL
jgi:hypothetical protein